MLRKEKEKKTKKEEKKEETKEEGEENLLPRLRIKIRAYDHRLIDNSARQIVENALRQGVKVIGPIPLPTEIKKFTVNRSTFIHKDSREQFEMRIHKRLIDILNPTHRLIDSLQNLNLPAGVEVEIKM
ncbi:30S ribosomal protein S10 [bacterium]|nr:30S ribosomal protein S10 [bacterium]